MDELARAAGGPGGEVGALEQRHAVAARGGVERDAGAGDAAADDDHVELVLGERREGLAALDHERSLAAADWLRCCASSAVISVTADLASPNSIAVSGS